jgi:hypothetical protein
MLPHIKNATSDLPQPCFRHIICERLKEKKPLVSTAQVAFCIAKGIGHLSNQKIGHPSNAKIPPMADAQIGHLWYNMGVKIGEITSPLPTHSEHSRTVKTYTKESFKCIP